MSKATHQAKRPNPLVRFGYAYQSAKAWYVERLPNRRIVGDIVDLICQNHAPAQRRGVLIPWFTITNLAARRGKQNRNATRAIILEMMALPGAPIRINPYSDRCHQWRFVLHIRADWIHEASPMRPLVEQKKVCTFLQWEQKRRTHYHTIKVKEWATVKAQQLHAKVAAIQSVLEQGKQTTKEWAVKRPEILAGDSALANFVARVEAKQRSLGLLSK
ncbi:MAG: hypothetical protein JKX85_00550 [Phycisphaeraceae bacterium]|nr:hypothetical protein [Phycisphaeraceae bacterium]